MTNDLITRLESAGCVMGTCETCKWWLLTRPKDIPNGVCRRYPKAHHKHNNDFCGEHQPKEPT